MFRKTFIAFILLAGIVATPTVHGQTINKFITTNGGQLDRNLYDFDILRKAIATAGLVDALKDKEANLTLLAPTDLAFVALARQLGYERFDERGAWNYLVAQLTIIGEGDPIPVLREVLLYHVVGERLDLIQVITSDGPITTVQGGTFQIKNLTRIRDNDPDLTDARLYFPLNMDYRNGIVHAINRVMIPVDL